VPVVRIGKPGLTIASDAKSEPLNETSWPGLARPSTSS
jgi:nitrate/nitrite transport system ATP-binding protein